MKKVFNMIFILILLISSASSIARAQTPDGNNPQELTYYFRRSWGGEADQIQYATDIVVADDGSIFIALDKLDRILKISTEDNTFTTFGKPGYGESEISSPTGLALSADGRVYVTNRGTRVSIFTVDGGYLNSWGIAGTGPGEFLNAGGITIDRNGVVYVADRGNNRIQKFDLEGNYIGEIKHNPDYPNRLNGPVDVVVDDAGNVFIADGSGFNIEKYSSSGEFITEWMWGNLVSLDLDGEGNLYVMDTFNHTISKYTDSGQYISSWGFEAFRKTYGGGIDFKDGYIYLAYSGNHSVLKLNLDGSQHYRWGPTSPSPTKFSAISGITVDNANRIIVTDDFDDRIQVFNSDGTLQRVVTHINQQNGELFSPSDVAVDTDGNYYISDPQNDQIFVFSPNWDFIRQWGTSGYEEGQLFSPMSLTVDASKMVYVADNYRSCILKFNEFGVFLTEWCNDTGDISDMRHPYDITSDNQGLIYVVDYFSKYVFKFSSEGTLISKFMPSPSSGQLHGIVVDDNGNIIVSDWGYSSVRVLDPTGLILATFGGYGSEPGKLRNPDGVTLGQDGQIIVADDENLRVAVFSPSIPDNDPDSGLVQNGMIERQLTEWSNGGDISSNPVSISADSMQGDYSMLLGVPVPQVEQGQSASWAYTNFYIDPTWTRPVLNFNYKLHVNDNMHYSDFIVTIQNGVGDRTERVVLRDGYQPCTGNYAPKAGRDLGWRNGSYDLSAYKGQHIRVLFSNRNLWPISLGIWTNVDNIRVLDAGPLPPAAGPYTVNLPLINYQRCDIPDYTLHGGVERPEFDYK